MGDVPCCVCLGTKSDLGNGLVSCSGHGCKVTVHQGQFSRWSRGVAILFLISLTCQPPYSFRLLDHAQIVFSLHWHTLRKTFHGYYCLINANLCRSACYGIVNLPSSGYWYCTKCTSQERTAKVVSNLTVMWLHEMNWILISWWSQCAYFTLLFLLCGRLVTQIIYWI